MAIENYQTTNTSEPIADLLFLEARNGLHERTTKHYVKDCPYRKSDIPCVCETVPANFLCGTETCWRIGSKILHIDWGYFTEADMVELARTITASHWDEAERLLDLMLHQQNRPGL